MSSEKKKRIREKAEAFMRGRVQDCARQHMLDLSGVTYLLGKAGELPKMRLWASRNVYRELELCRIPDDEALNALRAEGVAEEELDSYTEINVTMAHHIARCLVLSSMHNMLDVVKNFGPSEKEIKDAPSADALSADISDDCLDRFTEVAKAGPLFLEPPVPGSPPAKYVYEHHAVPQGKEGVMPGFTIYTVDEYTERMKAGV